METTVQPASDTPLSRFLHRCARAWEARAEADGINRMREETLWELAHDCSVTPDQLLQLVKAGPHAADEMNALMAALGIDPDGAARTYPDQFRDMQLNCSTCTSKARCRNDLAHQVAAREYGRYCGNAEHLNGMRTDPDLLGWGLNHIHAMTAETRATAAR